MPKKFRQKARWKNTKNKQSVIRKKHTETRVKREKKRVFRNLCMCGLVLLINLLMLGMAAIKTVGAASCPDIKLIFARGSGEKRWEDQSYLAFKSELMEKLRLTDLSYDFWDLNYPAIGIENTSTLINAFVGRGEAYDFGASVASGVKNLIAQVEESPCPNTKFVLAGYSQGAMVVSKAIQSIDPEKIIYVATFGDPKIYLPEGAGLMPAACMGSNLSGYRVYVPDCRAYEGILGSYRPYQPDGYDGKLGTWCNHMDGSIKMLRK